MRKPYRLAVSQHFGKEEFWTPLSPEDMDAPNLRVRYEGGKLKLRGYYYLPLLDQLTVHFIPEVRIRMFPPLKVGEELEIPE